jgi:hypothetical protein
LKLVLLKIHSSKADIIRDRLRSSVAAPKKDLRKSIGPGLKCVSPSRHRQLKPEHRMRRGLREFSRKGLTPIAATHIGCAGAPEFLRKSS